MSEPEAHPLRIGSFDAVELTIDLACDDDGHATETLACWTVAQPEKLMDREALLSAEKVPDPPYWALVWIGARALASRMIAEPPTEDTRVLDLGCGIGLSGAAAGRAGAHVTFVDYADDCLWFALANAELHGLRNFEVAAVDFTKDRLDKKFDLILAADVVYEPESYAPLAHFLDEHLTADGEILLTESLRADARVFLEGLEALGFSRETEAVWVMDEGRRERTWVHRLRRTG